MKKEKQSPAAQIAAINEMVREATEPIAEAVKPEAEARQLDPLWAGEGYAAPGYSQLEQEAAARDEKPAPADEPVETQEHALESYDRWNEVDKMLQEKIADAITAAGAEVAEHIKFLTDAGRGLNLSDSAFIRMSGFILALKRLLLDVQEEIADLDGWIEDFNIEMKGQISEATYTDSKGSIKSKFSNPEMRDAEFLRFSKGNNAYQKDVTERRNLERLERRMKLFIENETRKHTDFRLTYIRETSFINAGPDVLSKGFVFNYDLTASDNEPAVETEGQENAG